MFLDRANRQPAAPAPSAAGGGVSPSASAATIGAVSGARRRARRAGALAVGAGSLAVALALPAAALAQVSFSGPTSFAAGDAPVSSAVGDFNGDSDPDLAVANVNSDDVSVLLGDGTGGFGAATSFAAEPRPRAVAVGDFNGDADLDLVVVHAGSGVSLPLGISVLLGDGTGGFGAATTFPAGDSPNSVAVGDFNGDSDPDVAVTNFSSDDVLVLLGDGAGGFGAATAFAAGNQPGAVAMGDFNGDGRADLAVVNTNGGSDDVSVLLGDGTGGFGAATNFTAGELPVAAAVGDFNGDGHLDLAVANEYSSNDKDVWVLLGDGTGGFGAATGLAAGNASRSVAVGDFNRDSDPDLAVANSSSDDVSVLLGDGAGGFGAATNFATGHVPLSVAVADLDGDGRPDLAVANQFSDDVSVLLNSTDDAPSAADDAYTTAEDTTLRVAAPGVLDNDADPNGDALSAVLVSGPAHGTLTLNADGSFTYTPTADYNGRDSFTYKAFGGGLDSNTATVSLSVIAVNDAPTVTVARGGSCGSNDRSGTINLTVADVDNSAATLTLSGASSNQALVANAQLSFGGAGVTRTLTATAAHRRTGSTTITITVSDDTATGTVAVTLKTAGNGKDTLTGTSGADMLFGQNGKDTLAGQTGNDLLCGGNGNDTLNGGAGADRFSGGRGRDTASDFSAAQGDTQDGTIP